MTTYLIYLLVILFPFGQLTRLPLPFSPSVRIYAHDVIMVILIGIYLPALLRKALQTGPQLIKAVGVFTAVAMLSLSLASLRYSLPELFVGSAYLFRWILYIGLYVVIYARTSENRKFADSILPLLAATGVISALFGLVQYVWYPNLRNLMYLGWDPHEYRVFGTFFDSGFTGLIYVITALLLSYFLMTNKQSQRLRWITMGSLLITACALALTYSRASFVALFFGSMVFSLFLKSIKPVAVTVVFLAAAVFFLPQPSPTAEGTNLARTTSVQARLSNVEQSAEIISDYPLFGVGFNMMRYENKNRNFVSDYEWEKSNAAAGLDNSFLFVFATTGIIGLITYIFMWFKLLTVQNTYQILILSTVGAIFTHSMFNNSLFYPWIMIWLWVLFGVAHAPRRF
ncbi:O-antigen ligase family protein [Candidatus Roizmanbacteria bacterium]|nr:O-antigen ligase family protein [Candidatus Roizmanbacteria bacterium]